MQRKPRLPSSMPNTRVSTPIEGQTHQRPPSSPSLGRDLSSPHRLSQSQSQSQSQSRLASPSQSRSRSQSYLQSQSRRSQTQHAADPQAVVVESQMSFLHHHLENVLRVEEILSSLSKKNENKWRNGLQRNPKLADLDPKTLDDAAAGRDKDKRDPSSPEKREEEENQNPEEATAYQELGPPKTPAMFAIDPASRRHKPPLERFTTVPLESLPNLKAPSFSIKNEFPTRECKDAFLRTRKAKTGITFIQYDEDDVSHAFPVATLRDHQKKKRVPHGPILIPPTPSPVGDASSDVSKWVGTSPNRTHGGQLLSKMSSQASLSNGGSPWGDSGQGPSPSATPNRSNMSDISSVTSPEGRRAESVVGDEEEEIHLYPVRPREELEELARILANDAGLVSLWRTQFTHAKERLTSDLEESLVERHSDRDDAYHSTMILSHAAKLITPARGQLVSRKGNNIWKSAKDMVQQDLSAFTTRKTFYHTLLRYIDANGGLRSEWDEKLLGSIRKRLETGHPVGMRLLISILDEYGADAVREADCRYLIMFMCEYFRIDYDDVLNYLTQKGYNVSSQKHLYNIKILDRNRPRSISTASSVLHSTMA